ncbi:homeobox protein notochord-like [Montipora capricornis]|uniref:homeobox protein notochord-like n=1 Tax=Montipora capricornis TaxID=246305 RepID=UPI0035F12BAC
MDSHKQETGLSFSIENILRDDFPKHRRSEPSSTSLSTDVYDPRSTAPSWSPKAPLLRCYALRYSPIFLRFLPNVQRMGSRLHQVNRVKELILSQHPQRIGEDHLRCDQEKDEERPHELDDYMEENDTDKDSEPDKCFEEKTPPLRKRRNRSHFTQYQLQYLEKIFSRQQYLTRDERTILARGLDMTELQIRNWFQNRRYHKKHRAIEDAKQGNSGSDTSKNGLSNTL